MTVLQSIDSEYGNITQKPRVDLILGHNAATARHMQNFLNTSGLTEHLHLLGTGDNVATFAIGQVDERTGEGYVMQVMPMSQYAKVASLIPFAARVPTPAHVTFITPDGITNDPDTLQRHAQTDLQHLSDYGDSVALIFMPYLNYGLPEHANPEEAARESSDLLQSQGIKDKDFANYEHAYHPLESMTAWLPDYGSLGALDNQVERARMRGTLEITIPESGTRFATNADHIEHIIEGPIISGTYQKIEEGPKRLLPPEKQPKNSLAASMAEKAETMQALFPAYRHPPETRLQYILNFAERGHSIEPPQLPFKTRQKLNGFDLNINNDLNGITISVTSEFSFRDKHYLTLATRYIQSYLEETYSSLIDAQYISMDVSAKIGTINVHTEGLNPSEKQELTENIEAHVQHFSETLGVAFGSGIPR